LTYNADDLTTHAVCLGMTGSGKTGLGIALLEEAALAGIPTLIVDPKGDMANLLLAFPDLAAADFLPWINPADAPDTVSSLDAYAAQVAGSWRRGLARWRIDGTRIAQMRDRTAFQLYTPGSDAGRQVSILRSLAAPQDPSTFGTEVERESISNTVSALLTLIDVKSDPVTGREHTLLSTLIERAWHAGKDVDLAALVAQVQEPPFEQLGVMPLETFYPQRERLSLALALNGLLASPRFKTWLEGDPLHVPTLLSAPDGRPQVSVFYVAHLSDVERLFFITLLLEQVRAWLRTLKGARHLRALLYIDELYGMMPPYPANPPTKAPLIALLKQARSQGLGLMLATQNPVDLDYKGLSNAGTWFIGRLQTANDRQRVLQGLSAASAEAARAFGGASLDERIAHLKPRQFLLHDVHVGGLVTFETRHTMSYLAGPVTRPQIRQYLREEPAGSAEESMARAASEPLVEPDDATRPLPSPAQRASAPRRRADASPTARLERAAPTTTPEPAQAGPPLPWASLATRPPALPAGVVPHYMPVSVPIEWAIHEAEAGGPTIVYQAKQLVYHAALLARAQVRIDNKTHSVHHQLSVSRVLPVQENDAFLDWKMASIPATVDDLDDHPAQGARFAPLHKAFNSVTRLRSLERDFADYVYRESALDLAYHPALKLTARPDESPSHFRRRCYELIQKKRDQEIKKLERSVQTKVERLEARIRREERELEQDELEYQGRQREELISAGESIFNLLRGRRHSRALSIASRKRRMTRQSKAEIQESLDAIDDLDAQIETILDEAEREQASIQQRWAELTDDGETIQVRPRKSDVFVETWGVVWLPYWELVYQERGDIKRLSLAAFGSGAS
jgi:hypothetical protein